RRHRFRSRSRRRRARDDSLRGSACTTAPSPAPVAPAASSIARSAQVALLAGDERVKNAADVCNRMDGWILYLPAAAGRISRVHLPERRNGFIRICAGSPQSRCALPAIAALPTASRSLLQPQAVADIVAAAIAGKFMRVHRAVDCDISDRVGFVALAILM